IVASSGSEFTEAVDLALKNVVATGEAIECIQVIDGGSYGHVDHDPAASDRESVERETECVRCFVENLPQPPLYRADDDHRALQGKPCDLGGIKPPVQPHDGIATVDLVIGLRDRGVFGEHLAHELALFRVVQFDKNCRSLSGKAAEAPTSGLAVPLHLRE